LTFFDFTDFEQVHSFSEIQDEMDDHNKYKQMSDHAVEMKRPERKSLKIKHYAENSKNKDKKGQRGHFVFPEHFFCKKAPDKILVLPEMDQDKADKNQRENTMHTPPGKCIFDFCSVSHCFFAFFKNAGGNGTRYQARYHHDVGQSFADLFIFI